jgi:hypothetical protein
MHNVHLESCCMCWEERPSYKGTQAAAGRLCPVGTTPHSSIGSGCMPSQTVPAGASSDMHPSVTHIHHANSRTVKRGLQVEKQHSLTDRVSWPAACTHCHSLCAQPAANSDQHVQKVRQHSCWVMLDKVAPPCKKASTGTHSKDCRPRLTTHRKRSSLGTPAYASEQDTNNSAGK